MFLVFWSREKVTSSNSLLLLVVAEVIRRGVHSHIEDLRIPSYSDIKGQSWNGVSDFVLIPKKTVMNAKGRLYYLLGQITANNTYADLLDTEAMMF